MAKEISNSLEGAWKLVNGFRDGEPEPPLEAIFTFAGDRLLLAATENGVNKNVSWSFKTDAAKNLLNLTLLEGGPITGESLPCLCAFQEDKLRLEFKDDKLSVVFILSRDAPHDRP